MSYGSIKVDTIVQHFDTVYYAWGIDSFIADGYGTLKLPGGIYDSVLRVHIVSIEKDSILSSGSYIVDSYRTETYNWYRPGFRFILCSQYYDTLGEGTLYLSDVWYCPYALPTSPTGIAGYQQHTRMFVYPNPASEAFMVELRAGSRQSALVSVTDITGKTVMPQQIHELLPGTNNISIRSSHLPSGAYLVRVTTAEGNYTRKIMIER